MGASNSKSSESPNHVFSADHPVRFSEGLVNSLQENPETDSTRAKNLELHIQNRVAEELRKQLEASQQRLSSTAQSISQEPLPDSKKKSDSGFDPNLDRATVVKDINDLRQKLNERKRVVEMDKDVARAKEDVVACLRVNDRRPLDCWKEVEKFKAEVGRLERSFVEQNSA